MLTATPYLSVYDVCRGTCNGFALPRLMVPEANIRTAKVCRFVCRESSPGCAGCLILPPIRLATLSAQEKTDRDLFLTIGEALLLSERRFRAFAVFQAPMGRVRAGDPLCAWVRVISPLCPVGSSSWPDALVRSMSSPMAHPEVDLTTSSSLALALASANLASLGMPPRGLRRSLMLSPPLS